MTASTMLLALTLVACGGEAGSLSDHIVRGRGFTVTLATGWRASGPQSAEGGTTYTIAGPSNANMTVFVFPPSASLFAGGDAADADLSTLLAAIGHQAGTTVLDAAPPSWTSVDTNPAMQYNATLLATDGVTKTQSEAIDTRHGSDIYYIVYGSEVDNFPATDSAARAMLATWRWQATPS